MVVTARIRYILCIIRGDIAAVSIFHHFLQIIRRAKAEASEAEEATCQTCGNRKSVLELRQTEQQLENLLELAQKNKDALQKILASYSHLLHPNHYLMISTKR